MRNPQKAAITAILGLAFGGAAGGATAETRVEEETNTAFAAVSNLAALPSGTDPQSRIVYQDQEPATASASGVPLAQAGMATGNVNSAATAQAILAACTSGVNSGQFQEDCNALVAAADNDQASAAQALQMLTPDQVMAQNNAALQQVGVTTDILAARMLGLRLAQTGGPGLGEALAAGLLYEPSGGGASADGLGGQTGVFFTAKYLNALHSRNRFSRGYDMDGWNLTAGADYRIGPNVILGVMGAYTQGTADYRGNRGRMTMSGWTIGAYGTYFMDNGLFFEGMTGYTWNDYDLKRRIRYNLPTADGTLAVNQNAESKPDGRVFHASLGGGYQRM